MLQCITFNGLTFRNICITYIVMVMLLCSLHKQQSVSEFLSALCIPLRLFNPHEFN